jgi:hypothetical protein
MTKYLLIALVLSLGFGQLLRFELWGIPVYFHDLIVALLLILNMGSFRTRLVTRDDRSRIGHMGWAYILIALGLATGWLVALATHSPASLLVPALYTLRFAAYLALYIALQNTKSTIPTTYFLLAGVATATIGYIQYFLLPDMRWAQYLGWDDHLFRLTLPHYDPTFTGVMLGLTLLTFTPHLCATVYQLLGAVSLFPALLLTYARSVWLALAATLLLSRLKIHFLIIGICVSVLPVFWLPKKTGEGTNLIRTFSIESRLTHDLQIVKDLNWRLVTGVGLNTFVLDQTSVKGYPNHAYGPNNSYLFALATMGLPGLMGLLLFIWEIYQRSAYRLVLIFFCTAALFNNVVFYPFVLLYILLLHTTSENPT